MRNILVYLHMSKLILSQYLGTTSWHNTYSHYLKGHTHELYFVWHQREWGGECMVGWLTFVVTLKKLHTHCFWRSIIWPTYIEIGEGTWFIEINFIIYIYIYIDVSCSIWHSLRVTWGIYEHLSLWQLSNNVFIKYFFINQCNLVDGTLLLEDLRINNRKKMNGKSLTLAQF